MHRARVPKQRQGKVMAESIHEQMEYGSRCRHGVNLGTPGGADLMCGYCEMGLDTWVEDPLWQLQFSVTWDGHQLVPPTATDIQWRESGTFKHVTERLISAGITWQQVADESNADVVMEFWFKAIEPGRWVEG